MQNSIFELQEKQFGGIHNFHTERTANIIDAVYEVFGEDTITILDKAGVDSYGLFRWHIERTLSILDTLEEAFGQNIFDIVLKRESSSRYEEGKRLAEQLGSNTINDIIPFFTGGHEENIIEKNDRMVIVKSTGCLVGRIAYELDRNETLYSLHCGCDKDFVEGFNCNLGCEVLQTIMDGNECCIHRIFMKDKVENTL
jgi:hypothetical protein